jgi:hypothetical protein
VIDLAKAGRPRNDIARELGIGAGTVSRICSAAGVSFERLMTKSATVAKQADQAARRASLAGSLLDDLEGARRWLAEAEDSRGLRDAANAIQSLASAHARLATVPASADDKADHARSLLGQIAIGLQLVHGTGEVAR